MPLIEEFESVGHWLFRWRSYLPLITTVLLFFGLQYFSYPLGSHFLDELWELLCLMVSFVGLIIRALTVGWSSNRTSGRHTAQQVADTLNTTGMYSIVRNPLYLGNFLMVLGVVIFLRVWWIPFIYVLLFVLYYERIIFAEEMFLTQIWDGICGVGREDTGFLSQTHTVANAGFTLQLEENSLPRVSWNDRRGCQHVRTRGSVGCL